MNAFFNDLETIGGKIKAEFTKVVGEADADFLKIEPIAAGILTDVQPYLDLILSATLGTPDETLANNIIAAIKTKLTLARVLVESVGVNPSVVSTVQAIAGIMPTVTALLNIKSASATAATNKVATELNTVVTAVAALPEAVETAVQAATSAENAAAVVSAQPAT